MYTWEEAVDIAVVGARSGDEAVDIAVVGFASVELWASPVLLTDLTTKDSKDGVVISESGVKATQPAKQRLVELVSRE